VWRKFPLWAQAAQGALSSDGKSINGHLAVLAMHFQMEAFFEKRLQHQHQLVACGITLGAGVD
jgi:hypothetical protein